jgi:hypothetical protein
MSTDQIKFYILHELLKEEQQNIIIACDSSNTFCRQQ